MKKLVYFLSLSICILFTFGFIKERNLFPNSSITSLVEFKGDKTLYGNFDLKNGLLSPGFSPGKITVNGNLSFGNGTVYKAELMNLSGPGVGNDQITVTGNLSLNGTLNIILDGYIPVDDDQFEILSYGGTLNGTFSSINWPNSMSSWDIDYGVLAPNKVIIYGPNFTPLPVELLSFSARIENNQHVIIWQTATETNSDYFILEHSSNGVLFSPLYRISSQVNSSTIQSYSYVNTTPEIGENYYRLKQVDLDGTYDYSKIISLLSEEKNSISFYPNPVVNTLHFFNPVQLVVLYDSYGNKLLSVQSPVTELDLSQFPSGVYFLYLSEYDAYQKLIIAKDSY